MNLLLRENKINLDLTPLANNNMLTQMDFDMTSKPRIYTSKTPRADYFIMSSPCPFIPLVVNPRFTKPAFDTLHGKEITDVGVWK